MTIFSYLFVYQFIEETPLFHKAVVVTLFDYLSSFQHQNTVTGTYGAQPVGNAEPRAIEFFQIRRNLVLGYVVEGACRLVKEQYRGPAGKGSCNE